jgi:hypothetical protein
MDKKHNPLTTPYPKFDKVLALVRKGLIITETTELQVDFHLWQDTLDVYVYPSKESKDWMYTSTVRFNELYNDNLTETKYVFNHILKKGSFPKTIPEFDSFQQQINRSINLTNKLKNSK